MAHIPLALKSSLYYVDVLAVFGIRVSPDKGTNLDFIDTSLHTSPKRFAVMFLDLLCLEETNPPFSHRSNQGSSSKKLEIPCSHQGQYNERYTVLGSCCCLLTVNGICIS